MDVTGRTSLLCHWVFGRCRAGTNNPVLVLASHDSMLKRIGNVGVACLRRIQNRSRKHWRRCSRDPTIFNANRVKNIDDYCAGRSDRWLIGIYIPTLQTIKRKRGITIG